jgi:hypothetical protein
MFASSTRRECPAAGFAPYEIASALFCACALHKVTMAAKIAHSPILTF